jgi:hypothetical protein
MIFQKILKKEENGSELSSDTMLGINNWRRPQPNEMRSIFASLGLGGDFWDPQSDTFG